LIDANRLGSDYQDQGPFVQSRITNASRTASMTWLSTKTSRQYTPATLRAPERWNHETNLQWQYSPKLSLSTALWTRLQDVSSNSALWTQAKGWQLQTSWQLSAKTQLRFTHRHETQTDALPTAQGTTANNAPVLTTRNAIRLYHAWHRGLGLFVDMGQEQQHNNTNAQLLRQRVVLLGLEYAYENIPNAASRIGLPSESLR
jgi:hypothetical protein